MEDLLEYFNDLTNKHIMISLVGAGGKTTLSHFLAKSFASRGLSVLLTTTTQIFIPSAAEVDSLNTLEDNEGNIYGESGKITCLGKSILGEKILGIDPIVLDTLFEIERFDVILVEADGAKMRPIKVPAQHEPVIPKRSTHVIGIMGMDALGKAVSRSIVHRLDLFLSLTGLSEGDLINEAAYEKIINHPMGLFKGASLTSELILFLNKAHYSKKEDQAKAIIESVLKTAGGKYKKGYWQ